ncbi:hypothetical protein OXX69_001021 [Metschnikowia pulcherrima]
MAALLSLIVLNVIMAITTFATGAAAVKFSIASSHMAKVSALSTGILIGTALGVILPEGVSTLFEAQETLSKLESFGFPPSFVVGASLLLGFIVLFVIEHALSIREATSPLGSVDVYHQRRFQAVISSILRSALTMGLIVHSFVDGFALGASFLNQNETLQFLFFFMIVIHKIPTAFSLSVVLLREGVSSSMCKFHNLAFALTTPLSVLHVMKENVIEGSPQPAIASVQQSSLDSPQDSETKTSNILFTIAGMLVPLFFSLTGAD